MTAAALSPFSDCEAKKPPPCLAQASVSTRPWAREAIFCLPVLKELLSYIFLLYLYFWSVRSQSYLYSVNKKRYGGVTLFTKSFLRCMVQAPGWKELCSNNFAFKPNPTNCPAKCSSFHTARFCLSVFVS